MTLHSSPNLSWNTWPAFALAVLIPCNAASAAVTNVTSPTPGALQTHCTLACAGSAGISVGTMARRIAQVSRFVSTRLLRALERVTWGADGVHERQTTWGPGPAERPA